MRLVLAALLAASIAACSGISLPSSTLHEDLPAPGSFHLTSDPPQAPRALSLRYLYQGEPSGISDEFVAGATVVVRRSSLPELHGVQVNGARCAGQFPIVTGIEIDIILVLTDVGCRVETTGSHPEGAVRHGDEPASLFGQIPLGSRVSIRPISPGLVTPVQVVPADESGSFHLDFVPIGRYEVTLIVDEEVRARIEIDLEPGEEQYVDFSGALRPASS